MTGLGPGLVVPIGSLLAKLFIPPRLDLNDFFPPPFYLCPLWLSLISHPSSQAGLDSYSTRPNDMAPDLLYRAPLGALPF